MPNGYYDREQGMWIPQPNGRVIQIVSVTGGLADVDVDGTGIADATKLAALGLSDSERLQLATIYAPGQSLWRMPMRHFSPGDWNPSAAPWGATAPDATTPDAAVNPGNVCEREHSIVECQTQALGERIGIVGTPYTLNYRSSRQPGRRASYRLNLTVPGAKTVTMPDGPACLQLPGRFPPCQNTFGATVVAPGNVFVQVAGRQFQYTNTESTPSAVAFEWDGLDAYGRQLQGEQPVKVRTCLTYPAVYYAENSDAAPAFAAVTTTGATLSWRAGPWPLGAFDSCREWKGKIGAWDDRNSGLGGWTLSDHHVYDPRHQTIYRGDGERSSGTDVNQLVLNVVMGKAQGPNWSEGANARSVGALVSGAIAAAPDGSVYVRAFAEGINWLPSIWKMKPDGTVTQVVSSATLNSPGHLSFALGPDGLLFVADGGNGGPGRVFRVERNGALTTLVTFPTTGADEGIAFGPEGALYFTNETRHVVFKRGTDGSIVQVAGVLNSPGFSGDGGLATRAQLHSPDALAVGQDGTLYIADSGNFRVRAVGSDGKIRTFAGAPDDTQNFPGNTGCDRWIVSPGPATARCVGVPDGLAVSADGTVYIATFRGDSIFRVTADGWFTQVETLANFNPVCDFRVTECPSTRASIGVFHGIALDPLGRVLFTSDIGYAMRLSSGITAASTASEVYIASRDATEVYVFDQAGRHLRTLDAVTTAVLRRFGYDSAGRLTSTTDRDGNVTTIERDGQGNPTALVSPYGQRTALGLDGNGYLASITNPAGERVALTYKAPLAGDPHTGGLLSQLIDPRDGVHSFEHDSDGFLLKDTPPDGSYLALSRNGKLSPGNVTVSTPLGRTTRYSVTWSKAGDAEVSSITNPAGLTTMTVTNADHGTSTTSPDGMQVTTFVAPDPRFGMDAYSVTSTAKTPSGLTRTVSETRTATMTSATDPLTLRSLLTQVSVNGRTSSNTYDGVAKTITLRTPVGRQTVVSLDAAGRVSKIAPPGVQPLVLHYDARGRNDSVTQAARVTTLSYDAGGFLQSVLDPAQRTTSFASDPVGRPVRQTLPDLTAIGLGYDANGNVTSVAPPSRPAHAFAFTPADLESDYTPPGGASFNTHTEYDLDQQVSSVSRPDGDFLAPTYDPVNGRLTALSTSRGTTSIGYSPTTGQLTSVTTSDGVGVTYGYDGALLKSVISSGPVAGSIVRGYDASFRLTGESYGGQSVVYGYDNDDLLTSVGAMSIARDPATGFVTGGTLGGVAESRTYNAYGEEQTYTASAGGAALYSVDYGTRDALGRIVTKTETVQGVTHVYGYAYDSRGRLTDVTTDGAPTSHYEYDANGNRLVAPGLTASPVYDAQDRMTSYGSCSYTYKADGSLQAKTCPDGTTMYDYDAFGNLRHVTLPNATSIDYVIDGQNRRVGKKVNGVLVEGFVYRNQLQPAVWLNGDGSVRATFVYGLHANVPEYMVKGGMTYRLITDQVGSVRLVVDSTGNVAERIDYDEFGNVLADSAAGFQPFGLAGGRRDLDSGLTRFGARDYDPGTGRWTAKDPIRFDGGLANLYGYTGDDPVNLTDPDGLDVYICQRPADLPGNIFGLQHQWLKTNKKCVGAGQFDPNSIEMITVDHCSDKPKSCEKVNSVNEQCVDEHLVLGQHLGRFGPNNNCQTYVKDVVDQCSIQKKRWWEFWK